MDVLDYHDRVEYGTRTIDFDVVRSDRTTLGLHVHPDGSVVVRAPTDADREAIRAKVRKRARWIAQQQRDFASFVRPPRPEKEYLAGETHRYLGKQYRIRLHPLAREPDRSNEGVELRGQFYRIYTHRPNDPSHTKAMLTNWFRDRAETVLPERFEDGCEQMAPHGIEAPETRVAAGKPAAGRLHLSAEHHQGQVVITLADDGAGLDAERILAKARASGLVGADEGLEAHDIHQLIFEPGLSTAASVSDVSGRGVGMDVVKSSVESLQGRISVASEPGAGTRISIRLPMTLAIIDGLMLAVGESRFVLPLTVVEECIETRSGDDIHRGERHDAARLVEHRDRLLPCLRLRDCFDVTGSLPPIEQSVIVKVGNALFGITVDAVIGHHQTVIKGLGRLYQGTPGVMGATILGNGEIAMILDVAELFDESR